MTDATAVGEASTADEKAFEQHLQGVHVTALRVGGVLIGLLVPTFAILDYLVIPQYFMTLLALRIAISCFAAITVGLTFFPVGKRWVGPLSNGIFLLAGLMIVAMIHLHLGYRDPYYAGLMLVILGAGVLFKWKLLECYITYGGIYIAYITPCLFQEINEISLLVSNNFFLLSTIIVASVAQTNSRNLQRSAFLKGRALEVALNQLKELDRIKSQFFSNITHELRTPLTMILSPLESLIEGDLGDLNEDQKILMRPLHRNALRLLKLINDLLDLARFEDRFMRIRVERVNPEEMLALIAENCRPLAARKGIDFRMENQGRSDNLFLDRDRMDQALINLVANALKFTAPGGKVCLTMEVLDGEVQIQVQDTGIGIPEDLQLQIFERFHQADGSISRQYGGTGIGLALSSEIVDMHGGAITVESIEGEGSTFTVTLKEGEAHFDPKVLDRRKARAEPPEGRRTEDREPQEWTRQLLERKEYRYLDVAEATERRLVERGDDDRHSTKVLVVEDTVEVLRFIHLQLRSDHSVYLAKDGAQGLELAKREHPDVIITDMMMPVMDGITMVAKIREVQTLADTPVIMLTANMVEADRLAARDAGADVYMNKPFNPKELKSAVQQLLKRRGHEFSAIAREQVRSLAVISAGLAHEIHNPLNYIKSSFTVISEKLDLALATLAREDLEKDERAEIMGRCLERVERMRTHAETGISRIEQVMKLVQSYARDGFPSQFEPMKLDEAIRLAQRLLSPGEGKDVTVELHLDAPEATVNCVAEEMNQVIGNLWQNAMDAVDPGGKVQIRTTVDGDYVILEVADDGPGISRENMRRIFAPFFTTKGLRKGMGLGLAIAHRVVNRAGGELGVESVEGNGATFKVKLPLAK